MSELSQRIADLSPEKHKLLLQRLNENKGNSFSRMAIKPQSRESNSLPLSFAQQRLWFLAQLEPDSPFYNIPTVIRLQGQLNRDALAQSFNEIVCRHEALRTNFNTVEGQPVAVISTVTPLELPLLDLSDLPQTQKQAQVKQLASAEAQHPFSLTTDPLLRLQLLRLGQQEHILLLTLHHIVSDGWSIGVMVRELATLYKAFASKQPSPLSELPIQYADFAAWQRQWLQGEVLASQMSYWREQLAGAPALLELPTDKPRPAVQTFRGASYSFELSKELTAALNQLSQQAGSTLFMTLLSAFNILLARHSSSEDIVMGTPIANRHRAEVEGLIGFFVNTLVLRTDLGGNPRFLELLSRVREVALGAYAHQDLPFEQLVEELQPHRSLSHTALFQVMFVLQNAPLEELELPGLRLSFLESESGTAQFDLTLNLEESADGLIATFEYSTDLFEAATISRMAGHFQTLLEAIVANPEQRLSELAILSAAERDQLLSEWNNTGVDYPKDQCIHQLVEAQVQRTPDAVAVVFEEEQLTYRELNQQANQLADYLNMLGVKPEVLVGICVERSIEMVVGLLGILKAGGAYVPLDPAYPQERLAFMIEDSQMPVLLTQKNLLLRLPKHQAQIVFVDTNEEIVTRASQENPKTEVTPENLAYTIYTSGSTGKPKGVQIVHRSVVNFLNSMRKEPGLTESDVLFAVTTISFDIAGLELYLPLIVGTRIVLVRREIASDAPQLIETLAESGATVMQATPATWRLLLAAGWQGNKQLKILCGGEALTPGLANHLLEKVDSLWNMYGPTETTIWSAVYKVESGNTRVPIGQPIDNTQIYLLETMLRRQEDPMVPVPTGMPGEMYIGGAGLARGYLNCPELTAEKFIRNPFDKSKVKSQKSKLYKTGDLARYLPDGNIEYLGRIDDQVKLRGFRIELGEIEAALNQHPQVRETVVVAREDQTGNKCLVAYIVPNSEANIATNDLRALLQKKLPDYMVPAAFTILEALPLTPNGKVDRNALPAPDRSRSDVGFVPPRNPTEEGLAAIYAEVLGLEKISVYDNFFELGGHSLLATRVVSRLREAFEIELPLHSLFERPTVAGLAERIETIRLALVQVSRPPIAVGKGRKEIEL